VRPRIRDPISLLFQLKRNDMTRISTTNDVITLINVFTVDPANQQRLVELLTEATEVSVRQAPGFVSASLHRSTDGTKVTMYAQWQSLEAYQAMRGDGPMFFEPLGLVLRRPRHLVRPLRIQSGLINAA
jgi:quinol monooxygenase YgiN